MSTKPFWFAFNTDAWLSSKSVRMMSLAERGAYIGLLATAWGEDLPGTLPAAEDFIRRLSEMSVDEWKVSGPVILAMFPLSACGSYRYNPRLLKEAGKREELSEKKAEAGRKSAELKASRKEESDRLATQRQQNGNTSSTPVKNTATGVAQNANQLQSQLQLQSTNVDGNAPLPAEDLKAKLSNDLAARLAALTDTSGEVRWNAGILNKPEYFARIAGALTRPETDFEHYRKAALIVAEADDSHRTIKGWESWVVNYFTNQLQRGKLLTCTSGGTLPSQPTPSNQYPEPGHEQPGQVFYISGSPGDQNQDKMAAHARLKHYPAATVVSLAYPQTPYTFQNGTTVRG